LIYTLLKFILFIKRSGLARPKNLLVEGKLATVK